MTVEDIKKMSYTQFVAFIDQWNVPPGSLDTINQWAIFGHVSKESTVLEIACTTGLSSREIARITGCKAEGIDICKDSIDSAMMNARIYGQGLQLEYKCSDACTYKPHEKYTHLIIGASLGFFEKPNILLNRIPDFFEQSGYILASPYYSCGVMPESLKDKCRQVIGISPTTTEYNDVRNIYADFEVAYEKRCNIVLETKDQMEKYTRDSINRASELRGITDPVILDHMYNRLYEIKYVSNELHKYQAYSVMVLRYLKGIYPNKFMELF